MKNKMLNRLQSIFKNGFFHLLIVNSVLLLSFVLCHFTVLAGDTYISKKSGQGLFPLVANGQSAALCVSPHDYPGVLRVAGHLQTDIKHVTGIEPNIMTDETHAPYLVIIGTIGKNPIVDKLIEEKKIHAEEVINRWDTYALQTVKNPLPSVEQALVIFGSNKRGTIYGMYDLSSQIGVSPWYWWADAPIKKKENVYIKPGFYSPGEPKVKYRGIFINDEAPALRNWAKEKFGGHNTKFYEKVFGWKFYKWDNPSMDYWLITTGDEGPGINGGMGLQSEESMPNINTINVESLDKAIESDVCVVVNADAQVILNRGLDQSGTTAGIVIALASVVG